MNNSGKSSKERLRKNQFFNVEGKISGYNVNEIYNVRSSISVKPGVKIADGGDGSSVTPYEFVVE